MVRVKCSVSYDGSKFHGFQVQNKLRTVQGEIQKALKNICKEEIIIHGSGRTDAKVHGTKQVFHFDTTREMPEAQWKRAINHFLPNDIYILDSYFVDENFHSRYSNSDSFNANINMGIRRICQDMGMSKEEYYCFYTFRHTWATIAQNDCGANMYEVAFGMNHSHGFNITRGYVKIDFTPAWELNAKIIDFIFFSNKNSKQSLVRNFESPAEKMFRITKKMMIYGRAYFKGEVIAEVTDIGFDTVDDVISALANQLPNDIPVGCNVQFRLTNCDSQKEAVYVRSKGKGF